MLSEDKALARLNREIDMLFDEPLSLEDIRRLDKLERNRRWLDRHPEHKGYDRARKQKPRRYTQEQDELLAS